MAMQTKGLKRVQTTPFGAETTSAYWYEDINQCAYWMSVVQHPYGESDVGRAADPGSSGGQSLMFGIRAALLERHLRATEMPL